MAKNTGVPSYVPTQYRGWVTKEAGVTGMPDSVVAAQINEESGFNPNAVSSTGAEGIAQFEPGTWKSWGKGSPFNVGDAFTAYGKYMSSLLKQEHGNVADALAAYNAGPADLSAGAGYASTILHNAGQPGSVNATPNAQTTAAVTCPSLTSDPIGWATCKATAGSPLASFFLDPVDGLERVGLVVFGAILILVGIAILGFGPASKVTGMVVGATKQGQAARAVVSATDGGSSTAGPPDQATVDNRSKRLELAERNTALGERKQQFKEQSARHKSGREPNPHPKHN